jgi:hypothetical protein
MKVLFMWYEPVKYGRRISRTPLFDRLFPFAMSALAGCMVFGSAAQAAGEIRGLHVALSLLLFGGGGLLFSRLFPYAFRAEVWMLEGGVRRVVGRATGKYFPYEQIERCSFSPGDDASYILMNVQMKGGYENAYPGPLYQTAIPAGVKAERVRGILREAKVAVDVRGAT